jgi:peptidoglycan/LPS O-acetylase OafA/YrhL
MNLHITKNYRPDIDGMRGLAVLLVVINHAFPQVLPSGFIGVDVFFIISGYLITNIILQEIRDEKFSLINFYSRRIRRIFPSLLVVLISSFAFGWFFLLGDEFKQLGKHIFGGATFISNIILWQESGYFDQVSAAKPLLNLWSLGVEEQYYIIWPLILLMLASRSMVVLKISIAIFIISFLFNVIYIYVFDDSSSAFFLINSIPVTPFPHWSDPQICSLTFLSAKSL